MNSRLKTHFVMIALALCLLTVRAQQVADTEYKPPIARPAYSPGKGPLVLLDEAHFNFHTATGRYLAFAELLRRDGYVVQGSTAKFTKEALQAAKILVIANALHERNGSGDWTLPIRQSEFGIACFCMMAPHVGSMLGCRDLALCGVTRTPNRQGFTCGVHSGLHGSRPLRCRDQPEGGSERREARMFIEYSDLQRLSVAGLHPRVQVSLWSSISEVNI